MQGNHRSINYIGRERRSLKSFARFVMGYIAAEATAALDFAMFLFRAGFLRSRNSKEILIKPAFPMFRLIERVDPRLGEKFRALRRKKELELAFGGRKV